MDGHAAYLDRQQIVEWGDLDELDGRM